MNGEAVDPQGLQFTPEQRERWAREAQEADRISQEHQDRERVHRESLAAVENTRTDEARESLKVIDEQIRESLAAEREAERILKEGLPFKYFIDTFRKDHEGDLSVARCMALIFAASTVSNGDGLHGLISGKSGGGKSHAVGRMIAQLPDTYKFEGPFSEKYLYYSGEDGGGINEGSVIAIDDKTLSDTLQEIIKEYTTKYQDGMPYKTVVNQKPKNLKIPPCISFVLLKVDDPGDDQILNRMIQCRVNEDEDKAKRASLKIQEKYSNLLKKTVTRPRYETLVCREMWARIKERRIAVEIPCSGKVRFKDYGNLRNHEIFFNIMMCHAAIHRWQRKEIGTTQDGIPVILATKQDYDEAVSIYQALFDLGGQRHNTTATEDKIIKALLELNPEDGHFTIPEVAAIAGMDYQSARRAMVGRKATNNAEVLGGLLQKCPAIQKIGRRGRYELEIDHTQNQQGEIIRKEHFNVEIYKADIPALSTWKGSGSPVDLEPGFKWEA